MKKLEFELQKKDSTSPKARAYLQLEQLRKSALDGIKDFIQDRSDSLKEVGWVLKYYTHTGETIDPPTTEQWLTSGMMAKKLGVSTSTVQRWIKPMRGKYVIRKTAKYYIYRFSSVMPLILYDIPQKGSSSLDKKQSKTTRVKEKSKKKSLSQQELDISVSEVQEAAEGVKNMNYQVLLNKYMRAVITETGTSQTERLHKHYNDKAQPLFTHKEKEILVNTGKKQRDAFVNEMTSIKKRVNAINRIWVRFLNKADEGKPDIIEHPSKEYYETAEERKNA